MSQEYMYSKASSVLLPRERHKMKLIIDAILFLRANNCGKQLYDMRIVLDN